MGNGPGCLFPTTLRLTPSTTKFVPRRGSISESIDSRIRIICLISKRIPSTSGGLISSLGKLSPRGSLTSTKLYISPRKLYSTKAPTNIRFERKASPMKSHHRREPSKCLAWIAWWLTFPAKQRYAEGRGWGSPDSVRSKDHSLSTHANRPCPGSCWIFIHLKKQSCIAQ